MALFFKPKDGWAADVIPFFWRGEYHLFYLKDYRDEATHGLGTPWEHLGTRDLVRFTEYPQAIARGDRGAQDLWIFTGCVVEHRDVFHIFYTGHNKLLLDKGLPQEAIMHATSEDLVHWTKDERNPILFADPQRYERDDWRDPFVFWNPETNEFWMLLAARLLGGPSRRRGCTALATSPDLVEWTIRDPFWAPGLYFTHECPDLFKMGDWWYLVFSEFSDRTVTRYRMSRSVAGPWQAPPDDTFDARAFYAAKTVSDGSRRFVCGWNPSRQGATDSGAWQWGGNLIFHEVVQTPDGTLRARALPELNTVFSAPATNPLPSPPLGTWHRHGDSLTAQANDGYAACGLGGMPDTCRIQASVSCTPETQGCGILLRMDENLENGYEVRWEPYRNRIVVDRWPRPKDQPFELERPLVLASGDTLELRVFVDGTVVEIYANDSVALSYRAYDRPVGDWGFFSYGGRATFSSYSLDRL